MIVKIQRPLASSMDAPPCLIYNEDRSVLLSKNIQDLDVFFGNKLKVYADVDINGSEINIKTLIQDQTW